VNTGVNLEYLGFGGKMILKVCLVGRCIKGMYWEDDIKGMYWEDDIKGMFGGKMY
jgi:hypothetical protein